MKELFRIEANNGLFRLCHLGRTSAPHVDCKRLELHQQQCRIHIHIRIRVRTYIHTSMVQITILKRYEIILVQLLLLSIGMVMDLVHQIADLIPIEHLDLFPIHPNHFFMVENEFITGPPCIFRKGCFFLVVRICMTSIIAFRDA